MAKVLDREEWLKIRQTGIGGSDAAAVAGLSRFRSPLQVYMEKLGLTEPQEETEAMYWGKKLEDLVAEEFSLRTGMKLRRRNETLRHKDYPWMIAHVDRLIVGKDEGLECKTSGAYKADEWEGDEIPWEYAIQCHHYMAVTGYSAWWIAVLIGGNKFLYKRIERDEEIIANLIKIESDFWNNHVVKRIPPDPDGSETSTEFVKSLYPKSNGKALDLPSETAKWIEQYHEALEAEKEARERKNEAQNRLQMLLGEYEIGRFKDWVVEWKTVERAGYTVQPTTYRRFRIRQLEV